MNIYIQIKQKYKYIQNYIFIKVFSIFLYNKYTHNKMINKIFSKDSNQWTQQDRQDVQYFFKCNPFFSQHYTEQKDFDQLVRMTYFHKINQSQVFQLRDNKRPASIVLLSGIIRIYQPEIQKKKIINKVLKHQNLFSDIFAKKQQNKSNSLSPQRKNTNFKIFLGEFIGFNQTIVISSQCRIVPMHGEPAEILFVPSFLYNQFAQNKKDNTLKIIAKILNQFFPNVQAKPINLLAASGCKIMERKINNYLYHYGDIPDTVYIIKEGLIKIERHGYSERKKNVVFKGKNQIIGDKDLLKETRQTSAICCSSDAFIISIPKKQFIFFAKQFLPQYKYTFERRQVTINNKSKKKQQSRKSSPLLMASFVDHSNQGGFLPALIRSRSNSKSKQQQQKQYRLIKHSHILLDAVSPKSKKIRNRRSNSSLTSSPVDVFEEKLKLYEKIRPNPTRLDLFHRII